MEKFLYILSIILNVPPYTFLVKIISSSEDNKWIIKHKKEVLDDLIDKPLTGDGYPYDYAIYAECKALEKKYKVEIVPLNGKDLDIKECNKCVFAFMVLCTCTWTIKRKIYT